MSDIPEIIASDNVDALSTFSNLVLQNQSEFYISQTDFLPPSSLSLMHIAAYFNSLECMFYLNEVVGISYREISPDEYLPLHYACANGSLEVVAFLLEMFPDDAKIIVHSRYQLGFLAINSKSPEILELLLQNGLDPNNPSNNNICVNERPTTLYARAIEKSSLQCLALLAEYSAKKSGQQKEPLLIWAAKRIETQAIPFLLDMGEDPLSYVKDSATGEVSTALSIACFNKNVEQVYFLLQRMDMNICPINVNLTSYPVHWICQSINVEIAYMMLKHDVNVNAIDSKGRSGPYYLWSKFKGKTDHTADGLAILDLLYEKGLDINKSTDRKTSVFGELMTAISKPYEAVQWMILHGGDVSQKLPNGKTILEVGLKNAKLAKLFQ